MRLWRDVGSVMTVAMAAQKIRDLDRFGLLWDETSLARLLRAVQR